MQKENTELYPHEWLAVAVVVGFISMLAASAYLSSPSFVLTGTPHHLVDSTIEVFVIGSVAHPGPHRVLRGTTVEGVLGVAQPLLEADMKRFNLQAKVRANQVVKVPAKKAPKAKRGSS